MKTIYYAHPVTDYGTEQEARDIATLEALGFEVANPNAPENEEAYKKDGMNHFLRMVDDCDALAFRTFRGGSIGAGVAKEIFRAMKAGKPVIEMPWAITPRGLNTEETRRLLVSLKGAGE